MSSESVYPATLYVVATPIGNLADLTYRAATVLQNVQLILAEDTRVSAVLLRHYAISTPVSALHQHNEARRSASVIEQLAQGQSIALISDAGTPGISDPGARLVREVRAAGHAVVPVPGASALGAAFSVAGIEGPVLFLGFLSTRSSARRQELSAAALAHWPVVLYEAPHRLLELADDLLGVFDPVSQVLLARELTKRFESIERMALATLPDWLRADPNHSRGEFVLVIEPATAQDPIDTARATALQTLEILLEDLPLAQAVRLAQRITGLRRNDLYQHALQFKPEEDDSK